MDCIRKIIIKLGTVDVRETTYIYESPNCPGCYLHTWIVRGFVWVHIRHEICRQYFINTLALNFMQKEMIINKLSIGYECALCIPINLLYYEAGTVCRSYIKEHHQKGDQIVIKFLLAHHLPLLSELAHIIKVYLLHFLYQSP